MQAVFNRYPAVAPVTGLIGGILLFDAAGTSLCGLCIYGVLFAAACLCTARRGSVQAAALLGGIVAGAAVGLLHRPDPLPEALRGRDVTLGGRICSTAVDLARVRMTVEAESLDGVSLAKPLTVWVDAARPATLPIAGDLVEVGGRLEGTGAGRVLPHQNDYLQAVRESGASGAMHVNAADVRVLGRDAGWRTWAEASRARILDRLYNSTLKPSTADLIAGLVCGEGDFLNPAVRDTYRMAGLAHLLALSGFHVGVFAMLMNLIVWPLAFLLKNHRLRMLGLLPVWVYIALTGLGASAVRAGIFLLLLELGRLSSNRSYPFNRFMLAAGLMLAVCPAWMYSAGFQLSFMAVAGLIAMRSIEKAAFQLPRLKSVLLAYPYRWVCVPLFALAGTLMLQLIYFHSLPLRVLEANMFAALTAPGIIIGGVVSVLTSLCGCEITALSRLLDLLADFTYSHVERFGRDGGALYGIYVSGWLIVGYYLALALCLAAVLRRRLWPLICGIAVMTAGCTAHIAADGPKHGGELHIPANVRDLRLVARSGSRAFIHSCGDTATRRNVYMKAASRYADWLHHARCVEFEPLAPDRPAGALRLRRNVIAAGPHTVALVRDNDDIIALQVDYVVLYGASRTLDLDSMLRTMRPRGVVLAPDLSPRRRRLYKRHLRRRGAAVHDASAATWSLYW